MTDSLILMVFLIAIVFLSGALLAATPWFMKKGECFAVTIPESAQVDEHWKAGIFYWNKDDASLILPKRFGIGWTMNWARPAAWLIVGGFTLASIAFVAACIFLM